MASVRANAPPHRALLAALLFNGGARVHGRDKLRHVYFAVGSKSSRGYAPLSGDCFLETATGSAEKSRVAPPAFRPVLWLYARL